MFWDNFMRLCVRERKSPTYVTAELGLSNAAASAWKNGSIPRRSTLESIAKYFNVTVDYLLADEKKTATTSGDGLSSQQRELIALVRHAPPEEVAVLLAAAKAQLETRKVPGEPE